MLGILGLTPLDGARARSPNRTGYGQRIAERYLVFALELQVFAVVVGANVSPDVSVAVWCWRHGRRKSRWPSTPRRQISTWVYGVKCQGHVQIELTNSLRSTAWLIYGTRSNIDIGRQRFTECRYYWVGKPGPTWFARICTTNSTQLKKMENARR